MKNDSVLISKDEWFKKCGFKRDSYGEAFDILWEEYEENLETLVRMNNSIINLDLVHSPIINPTDEQPARMQEVAHKESQSGLQVNLDKAIKLLEDCSSELFMLSERTNDSTLERAVDAFLTDVSPKCEIHIQDDLSALEDIKVVMSETEPNCSECKNCPTSLKEQAV